MNRFPCRYRQIPPLFIVSFALFWLCACGGGSGGDDTPSATTVSGQVLLGPLCGANVALYRYDDLQTAIHTTTTVDANTLSEAGRFEIPVAVLADDILYVVKIQGGTDIDADDDGVRDDTPTENLGTLHLAATGAQLRAGGFKANILTDIVYHKIAYLLHAKYPLASILAEMEQYPAALLRGNVDGDGDVDLKDLLAWNPVADMDKTVSSPSLLSDCAAAIHAHRTYADERAHIDRGIYARYDTPGEAFLYGVRNIVIRYSLEM